MEIRITLRGKKVTGTRKQISEHYTGERRPELYRGQAVLKSLKHFTIFADKNVGVVVKFSRLEERDWLGMLKQMRWLAAALKTPIVLLPNTPDVPNQLKEIGGVLEVAVPMLPPQWVAQKAVWEKVSRKHRGNYAAAIAHYRNKCNKMGLPAKVAA